MKLADRLLLVLLLIPVLFLLAPFLLGSKILYYRDLALVAEPHLAFFKNSLWRGEIPLWNPLLAGGFPQWSSLEPPFLYPLTILFLYFRYPIGLAIMVFLHLMLAGWGTYALGRELGWRRPAASLAALSFSLGGFMMSLVNLFTPLQFVALLPLVHLTFHRLCRHGTGWEWLWAIGALAWQTAASRPEYSLLTLVFLSVYALHLGYQVGRRPMPLMRLVVIVGAVLLLNAASILPGWEFIRHSNRQAGIPLDEAIIFSIPPLGLWQLVFPQLYGNTEWGGNWGRYFVGEPVMAFSQLFLSLYMGMGTLLMAGYALLYVRRSLVALLGGLALFALLMVLGHWSFLFGWFHHLPGFSLIRYPAKYLYLWTWSTVLLAGIGMDAWLHQPHQGRRYFAFWVILGSLLSAGVLVLSLTVSSWATEISHLDWSSWTSGVPDQDLHAYLTQVFPRVASGSLETCLAPLLFLVLLAGLAWRRGVRDQGSGVRGQGSGIRRRGNFLSLSPQSSVLLLVVALDLLIQARPVLYGASPDFFDRVPTAVSVISDRESPGALFRVHLIRRDIDRYLPWDPQNPVSWQETLSRWLRSVLFSLTPMGHGLASTGGSPSGLMPLYSVHHLLLDLSRFFAGDPASTVPLTIAGLMNVKYYLFIQVPATGGSLIEPQRARGKKQLRLLHRDERTGTLLYENLAWKPRATFVHTAVVVPSPADAFRLLSTEGDSWQDKVVITRDRRLEKTLPIRRARLGRQPGLRLRCEIREYRNQLVRIALESPESGYLVLSDNDYPGWEVLVDGEERPIMGANAVVRAVWVEAGRHEVVFRYRPRPFAIGCLIGLLTLGVLVGLVARSPQRHNDRRLSKVKASGGLGGEAAE